MGVTGLWQILSPAGRPVTLESLDGQVLAVDISIWLNQAISALRDSSGHAISNAHLLNLYQRLCKLMYFHIRPVFVFDGTPPALKQATLRARRQRKEQAREERHDIDKKLLNNFLQQHALNHVAQERSEITGAPVAAPPKLPARGFLAGGGRGVGRGAALKDAQMFSLPKMEEEKLEPDGYQLAVERHWQERKQIVDYVLDSDLIKRNILSKESVDFETDEFKSLPLDVQHEILQEIKLRRKDKHSWHKIKQMPKNPAEFMEFQLKTVLFRGKVTHRLDKLENEMKRESAGDLVTSLTKRYHGADETGSSSVIVDASKIASSQDGGHYLYIKNGERKKSFMSRIEEENRKQEAEDVKLKMEAAEMEEDFDENPAEDIDNDEDDEWKSEDEALERAIALSLQNQPPPKEGHIGGFAAKKSVKTRPHLGRMMDLLQDDGESVWKVAASSKQLEEEVGTNATTTTTTRTTRSHDAEEIFVDDDNDIKDVEEDDEDFQRALALSLQSNGEHKARDDAVDEVDLRTEDSNRKKEGGENAEIQQCDNIVSKSTPPKEAGSEMSVSGLFSNVAAPVVSAAQGTDDKDVVSSRSAILEMLQRQKAALQSSEDEVSEDDVIDSNKNAASKIRTVYEENVGDDEVSFVRRKNLVSTSSSVDGEINEDDDDDDDDDDDFEEVPDAPDVLPETNATTSTLKETIQGQTVTPAAIDFLDIVHRQAGTPSPEPDIRDDDDDDEDDDDVVELDEKEDNGDDVVELGDNVDQRSNDDDKDDDDDNDNDDDDDVIPEKISKKTVDLSDAYLAHREAERTLFRDLGSKLDEERSLLEESRQRQDRVDVVATDQMTADCQELLRLFGVPYVVASSEAEAQCAFLESVGLTQGTVTDDSDVWLFGGRVVYRNFFKKDKNVERFKMEEVQARLRLDRNKMICFAMLTGSDYTDGVDGVGGVTAFEFLHEFNVDGIDGLRRLRSWWEKNATPAGGAESFKVVGSSKVKNRLRQLTLSEGFPSQAIYDAYADPSVDDSLEQFSWASAPDVSGVREFARVKFGWTREKTDESLLPVVEKMKERKGDTIDKWVQRWSNKAVAAKKAQGIPSQRIKKVLVDLNVLEPEDLVDTNSKTAAGKGKGKGKTSSGNTTTSEEVAAKKSQGKDKNSKTKQKGTKKNDDEFKDPDSVGFPSDDPSKSQPQTSSKSQPQKSSKAKSTKSAKTSTSKQTTRIITAADSGVVPSRPPRSRTKPKPASATSGARASAGGGRGARKRVAKLNPVEQVLAAAASTSTGNGANDVDEVAVKHPKLSRPEVDPMLDKFSDDDDDDDDEEEMTRLAMIVEASQTDHLPKWETVPGKIATKKTVGTKSYKSVADLSESGSSSGSDDDD